MSEIATASAVTQEIDVWIVEDNVFFRDTVFELLESQPGVRCTFATGLCENAIAHLGRGHVPQVLLMDLGLPGMSGVEGIARVKAISPSTQIVVLTVHEDDEKVFEALCAGASGYLLKPGSTTEITEAVTAAVRGGSPMNAYIAGKVLKMFTTMARPRVDYGLTDREREILQVLVQDRTQKQIAEMLSLSPHTVDTHIRNIYAKLHVHSRGGAVAKALQERIL